MIEGEPVSVHGMSGVFVSPKAGKFSPSHIFSVLSLPGACTVPRAGAAAPGFCARAWKFLPCRGTHGGTHILVTSFFPADWPLGGAGLHERVQ